MYRIVHLPTGNYVVDRYTKKPIEYYNKYELEEQVFENRLVVFRDMNFWNNEEDTLIYIDLEPNLKQENIIPKYLFEIVDQVGFWNV